ncbi:YtxH domain-containing protein [Streptomyces aurantiacus]
MPADEVHYADSAGESRARTGPRHAAPRKPLFIRLHVPAGKAIAIASMPTAILMGMGFTPTLASAEDKPSSKNLSIDEYKDCVEALDDSKTDKADKDKDASATPSPSASSSAPASDDGGKDSSDGDSAGNGSSGDGSSSDSGSEDKPAPTPSASTSAPAGSGADASTPTPTQSGGGLLDDIGNALGDILTPGEKESATPTAEPSATPSASATKDASKTAKDATDTVKDTVDKAGDTVKDVTDAASEAAEDTKEKAEDAADEATASPTPSPSASSTTDPDDCPAATDDEGDIEQGIPLLADDPWELKASSLLLDGADYQGIVKVKTANGTIKKVLKYVISNRTDIGDLHQTVDDKDAKVKYHVQAGDGTTSTISDGKTVMYTESISGNLLGLVPITFDPKHPPPLNIPLIYFTNVTVVQAAQFGGTLTIPGMRQYNTPLG